MNVKDVGGEEPPAELVSVDARNGGEAGRGSVGTAGAAGHLHAGLFNGRRGPGARLGYVRRASAAGDGCDGCQSQKAVDGRDGVDDRRGSVGTAVTLQGSLELLVVITWRRCAV